MSFKKKPFTKKKSQSVGKLRGIMQHPGGISRFPRVKRGICKTLSKIDSHMERWTPKKDITFRKEKKLRE